MTDTTNPYAPTSEIDEDAIDKETLDRALQAHPERLSLFRIVVRWTFVCVISAIPSFVFGLAITRQSQILAMCMGIAIFAALYSWLDWRTAATSWRQNKLVRSTLRFTYGTRILISILFPVGAYLDVICGMLSTGIVQSITGFSIDPVRRGSPTETAWMESLEGFFPILLTTLVQGVLLNIVLAFYGIAIFGLNAAVRKLLASRKPAGSKTITVDPSSLNS